MTNADLLNDDVRAAGVSTLVEMLEYRAGRQPDEIVFRFVSGEGVEDGALTFARRKALSSRSAIIRPGKDRSPSIIAA